MYSKSCRALHYQKLCIQVKAIGIPNASIGCTAAWKRIEFSRRYGCSAALAKSASRPDLDLTLNAEALRPELITRQVTKGDLTSEVPAREGALPPKAERRGFHAIVQPTKALHRFELCAC